MKRLVLILMLLASPAFAQSVGIFYSTDVTQSGDNTFTGTNIFNSGLTSEGEIDMSNNNISDVKQLLFNTVDGQPCTEALMFWNDDDGTVNIGLKGSTVCLQTGQEVVTRVKNDEGSDIDNGEVVFVSGASGTNVEVQLPIASDALTAPLTFGLATEDIINNQLGYVTLIGNVRDINTSGSLVSETWNDGDVLYLSSTTAGAMTNVRPTQPNIGVILGVVLRAHATEGVISVNPVVVQRHSLSSDVLITSIADNDITYWDAAATVWKNEGLSNIGSGLTSGSVVFVNSGTEFEEDNTNFTWDDDNDELIVKDFGREAEMHGEEIITVLTAGGAWANITGLTNGVSSPNGIIQNSTDGSITVLNAGRYKMIGSLSIADDDSNSEEFHFSVAVNGVDVAKTEQHRSISVLSLLGSVSISGMLELSDNDVVTVITNSIGGDDLTSEHINWMLFK
jgi:hypothetical protein